MSNLKEFNLAIGQERTKEYLKGMLGSDKKRDSFVTTLTAAVSDDKLLQECEPMSIMYAALKATALDLPIDKNLGLSALIPYKDKKNNRTVAQFQVMRNGWVELAQRSGKIRTIVNEIVHEGELVSKNKFTGDYIFDENKRTSDKVIGYMAYVRTTDGFEKTVYWDVEKCRKHGQKYSKNYNKETSLWKTSFDEMCLKTVLKHLINKYVPKSPAMLEAIRSDQAVIGEGLVPQYIDNPVEDQEAEDVTNETPAYNDLVEEKKEELRQRQNTAPELP